MPALYKLSASKIRNLPMGKYSDGGGLWLNKRRDGSAQWFLRVTVNSRRREMGLGPLSSVSLATARDEASKWREMAFAGHDPIRERERQSRDAQRSLHLLKEIAADAFEAKKAELKGDGKSGRWFSPIELHVLPTLGHIPITDIDQVDIRDTLNPIWHCKADTARKSLNRLSIIFRHAAALGLPVDIQACDKAKALLGKQRHVAKHVPAMPWVEVPDFYQSLSDPTLGNLALRLLILTGARSFPLRNMRLEDVEDNIWTVPAEQMKGQKGKTASFRIPLSTEALNILESAALQARDGYVFPNVHKGIISDATMSSIMRRRKLEARPHGFRSSLRDWMEEALTVKFEVAETVLGHAVGGHVERAYRRTDYLEQRAEVLERWGEFCAGKNNGMVKLDDYRIG